MIQRGADDFLARVVGQLRRAHHVAAEVQADRECSAVCINRDRLRRQRDRSGERGGVEVRRENRQPGVFTLECEYYGARGANDGDVVGMRQIEVCIVRIENRIDVAAQSCGICIVRNRGGPHAVVRIDLRHKRRVDNIHTIALLIDSVLDCRDCSRSESEADAEGSAGCANIEHLLIIQAASRNDAAVADRVDDDKRRCVRICDKRGASDRCAIDILDQQAVEKTELAAGRILRDKRESFRPQGNAGEGIRRIYRCRVFDDGIESGQQCGAEFRSRRCRVVDNCPHGCREARAHEECNRVGACRRELRGERGNVDDIVDTERGRQPYERRKVQTRQRADVGHGVCLVAYAGLHRDTYIGRGKCRAQFCRNGRSVVGVIEHNVGRSSAGRGRNAQHVFAGLGLDREPLHLGQSEHVEAGDSIVRKRSHIAGRRGQVANEDCPRERGRISAHDGNCERHSGNTASAFRHGDVVGSEEELERLLYLTGAHRKLEHALGVSIVTGDARDIRQDSAAAKACRAERKAAVHRLDKDLPCIADCERACGVGREDADSRVIVNIQDVALCSTVHDEHAGKRIDDEVVVSQIDHVHAVAGADDRVTLDSLHVDDVGAIVRADVRQATVRRFHGEQIRTGAEVNVQRFEFAVTDAAIECASANDSRRAHAKAEDPLIGEDANLVSRAVVVEDIQRIDLNRLAHAGIQIHRSVEVGIASLHGLEREHAIIADSGEELRRNRIAYSREHVRNAVAGAGDVAVKCPVNCHIEALAGDDRAVDGEFDAFELRGIRACDCRAHREVAGNCGGERRSDVLRQHDAVAGDARLEAAHGRVEADETQQFRRERPGDVGRRSGRDRIVECLRSKRD